MGGKRLFVYLILTGLLVGCRYLEGQGEPARTFYESLDLETPESAVETFVEAFQREDWPTVWMIFAPDTQHWARLTAASTFDWGHLVDREHWDDILEEVMEHIDEGEYTVSDCSYAWFDPMMVAAKEKDAILIDLSGKVEISDSEDSRTQGGERARDVIAEVEGIDREVVFKMVEAPSGRWRVYQVIAPGGNEEIRPWAAPAADVGNT